MNRKTVWVALSLALLMALSVAVPAFAAQSEPVTLDVVMFQWWDTAGQIWEDFAKDSEVLKALEAKTGVKLNIIDVDAQQQQTYFASGNLGDLCLILSINDVHTLMDSELILPLNGLVEQYGGNIKDLQPERWKAAINTTGDGTNAYALPIQAGNEGAAMQNGRYIYTLRYNDWAELGFPEWANYYEYLDDIKKLVELHPTTDEGLPMIGVTVANDSTTRTNRFENRMFGTYGFGEGGAGDSIQINIADGTLVNNFVDEISPYWLSIDFYRYAHKLGILDPDWAVQSVTERDEKYSAGRVISSDTYIYGQDYIDAKLEKDPGYLGGWINVPVKGAMFFQNAEQLAGWDAYFWAIPTSSKNPEAAIKFLNCCFGYEGGRFLVNGIENVHWGVNDKNEPVLKDAFFAMPTDKGERRVMYLLGMFRGLSNATITPDGSPLNLTYSPAYYASIATKPWLAAYDEYYGISWPNEKFVEYAKTGYMFDRARFDQRVMALMAPFDDEMLRIEALCTSTAIAYMARLVEAPTDEEFSKLKAEMLAELDGYGISKLYDYAKAKYDKIYEELGIAEYMAKFPAVQR